MKLSRLFLLFTSILLSAPIYPAGAQSSASPPIRRLMGDSLFRAAGLAKLSSGELETLNTWLIEFTANLLPFKAAAQPTTPASDPRTSGSPARPTTTGCYESSILSPNPFMGNNGEMFKLADGSLWEVKYEYEYMYEYYPSVVVCPDKGRLLLKGKSLNIQQISQGKGQTPAAPSTTDDVIESRIDGEFTGWTGETVFKLQNGQIWQQSSYAYKYKYAYSPKVLIYKSGSTYRMQVDGVDGSIPVDRLK